MRTRLLFRLAAAVLGLAFTCAAQAAMLHPNGVVLVNRGHGFERIQGPVECGPTDQVVVNEGTAEIHHANGVRTSLTSGNVYDIGTIERHLGQGGHGGPHGSLGGSSGGGLPPTALIAGGIGVAAGLAFIITQQSKPSSP